MEARDARVRPTRQDLVAPVDDQSTALHAHLLAGVMADTASNGRPAALFIAPIMPSDRGNGLAMRTGFLLDAYAKRFEIDLAVVPVAGGSKELTPFVEARTQPRHGLASWPRPIRILHWSAA